jgi:CheY-like chemotaxis protein
MNTQRPKKILVVDDNADLLDLVAELLTFEGYDVSTASDGAIAIEKIEMCLPDLILSDIRMPNMNGIAFRDELRNRSNTREIPMIFITGVPSEAPPAQFETIKKPVHIDELLAKVAHALMAL